MKQMSKFQIALLVIFGAFIILAVIIFSRNRGGAGEARVTLSIWGTLPTYEFTNALPVSTDITFQYTQKSASTISSEFTEALATGQGPDLIILPAENLLSEKNKLVIIPDNVVRRADFINTFIKGGEIFLDSQGAYALPLYVDPMVMYWNRDMFSKAGFSLPPVYWNEIYSYVEKLTTRDNAGNITASAMALGESRNIPNAKEVISLLMLQSGTPIVSLVGTNLRSVILDNNGLSQVPAVSALEFYTQFANPQKTFYSWNRSLLAADTHFTSGRSAMYLGFASELPVLKAKSPTLDIGVSPVPQSSIPGRTVTFGKIYGVAITRGADNFAGALAGATFLVSAESARALSLATAAVPARRDLLAERPSDPSGFVFYGAALLSAGWLDPNPVRTESIFTEMVESVTSGRARVDQAVSTANTAINSLLDNI